MNRELLPPNWRRGLPPLAWFGVVILIGAVVHFGLQTVRAQHSASVSGMLAAGGIAMFCLGAVTALGLTFFASAARYALWSPSGTTVRVHPAIVWTYAVALTGALVGSILSMTSSSQGAVTRFLLGCLLVISATGLTALLRSRQSGYVRIGPEGVTHADMFRTRSASWREVVDITDRLDTRTRNPIVLALDDGKPLTISNADRYGSGGAALYWMVRHYWIHPENRDQLVDGSALERLRNEDFEPE